MLRERLSKTNGFIRTYPYPEANREDSFEILEYALEKEGIQLKTLRKLDRDDGEGTACLVYLDELCQEEKEALQRIAEKGVYIFVITRERMSFDFTLYITSNWHIRWFD